MNILERIDILLDDDAFTWAFPALCGIRETISRNGGMATAVQTRAVENIANAGPSFQQRASAIGESLPSDRFKGSRRYESFRSEKDRV
jgi:hypothetical protein